MGVDTPLIPSEVYNKTSSSTYFQPSKKAYPAQNCTSHTKATTVGRMPKSICMCKSTREIWAKSQFSVQNYLIMRLPRQVCGVLWLNSKSTFSSLELGVRGVTKCSLSCSWGQESPWLQTGSPLLFWQVPPHPLSPCALWRLHVHCWRWDLVCTGSEGKTLCPDVLIPCGNPLHHTWPPMAGLDKVNDCCATEVTCAHWSLQCAHKRGPPPLLEQLNAFYLEICTIYVQFSPHTTKLH